MVGPDDCTECFVMRLVMFMMLGQRGASEYIFLGISKLGTHIKQAHAQDIESYMSLKERKEMPVSQEYIIQVPLFSLLSYSLPPVNWYSCAVHLAREFAQGGGQALNLKRGWGKVGKVHKASLPTSLYQFYLCSVTSSTRSNDI